MREFIHLVERSIIGKRLFCQGQKIVLAVSGGLDSMVLLHLLHRLSEKHDWRLVIAHFNHQLRGRSSDADERFVRRAAERFGINFAAGRADVKRWARQHKLSLEMAARHLRHEFLARLAQKRKASVIALGHHADDQIELFFLRLLRGAGGGGLAGMKWHSPSPSNPKVMLVRPLLGCSKNEIQAFALTQKIGFREDKTNAALSFLRNRCRHELLPLLVKHYQPALSKTTLRLMEVLEAESEAVAQVAGAWLKNRQPAFDQLPIAVQRRSLQLQLFGLKLKADFETIEHLRLRAGVPLTLRPGLTVQRDAEGGVQINTVAKPQFDVSRLDLKLDGKRGMAQFGSIRIHWKIERCRISKTWEKPAEGESFDAGKVGSTIALRHWRPGDRFQPIGMRQTVKLQDLFSNQKIPQARRHQLVIATVESGELFWVEGLRISEQFKLDKTTVRRLIWGWQSA